MWVSTVWVSLSAEYFQTFFKTNFLLIGSCLLLNKIRKFISFSESLISKLSFFIFRSFLSIVYLPKVINEFFLNSFFAINKVIFFWNSKIVKGLFRYSQISLEGFFFKLEDSVINKVGNSLILFKNFILFLLTKKIDKKFFSTASFIHISKLS